MKASRDEYDSIFLVWRGWLVRTRFLTIRNATLFLQRYVRSFIAKKRSDEPLTQDYAVDVHKAVLLPTTSDPVPSYLPLYINTSTSVLSSWFIPFVPHGYGLLLEKTQVIEHNIHVRIQRHSGIASIRTIEQVRQQLLCILENLRAQNYCCYIHVLVCYEVTMVSRKLTSVSVLILELGIALNSRKLETCFSYAF